MLPVVALRDNAALREKYQERFRYILVDEYQDTNHAQYMLAKMLSGRHKNICVVGDDDQSIYSWRGADIRNILEFERDYPGCKSVKLEQNYRSTPEVLTAAHRVVKNNLQRVNKTIWTENQTGEKPSFMENTNEQEEASSIVREIERLRREKKYRLSDFAVFYRTNAQSRVLEDAFRRNGTPYAIIGTVRFYERVEVKDILAYLRLVHNPNDNLSFKRVVNTPRRGIGKTTMDMLENFALLKGVSLFSALDSIGELALSNAARKGFTEFKRFIDDMRLRKETSTIKELAGRVISGTGYVAELEQEDTAESKSRIENINELMSAIDEFESRSPDKTVGGYLTQVVLVSDLDNWSDDNDAVTLMTLHLAKGLEFETVFITGLEEGLFPIGESAFSPKELEEERRLMYVGMTRARKTLYLSWAAERRVNGKSRWNMPSRFVEEAGWDGGGDRVKAEHTTEGDEPSSFLLRAYTGPRAAPAQRNTEESQPKDDGAYPLGCRVMHPKFGAGKVYEKSGAGDDLKLVIIFDDGGWKKVIAKYANLEKI
jgi:DNA helicase-2/ATP-dependent DNA helicase PcrA